MENFYQRCYDKMSLIIHETKLKDVFIIEPKINYDSRGFFLEAYNKKVFSSHGIDYNFIQDNHSLSIKRGTIRGIHYQIEPFAQTKLVRCIRGEIIDYAIDLRLNSDTFLQYIQAKLNPENQKQLLIPKGFGHAFITMEDNTEVVYKVDNYYSKNHERSINYLDPKINIKWPIKSSITISQKDLQAEFWSNES